MEEGDFMKKAMGAFLLATTIFLFIGCSGKPKYVPDGYTECKEYYDESGFQDYTDFCIYKYDSADSFIANKAYSKIGELDIENVKGYFEHFERIMKLENRMDEYTFDIASVSFGDYVRIETKEGKPIGESRYGKYDDYNVYFFDTDTKTLYYIHTNI